MNYQYLEALPIPATLFARVQFFLTNIEFSYYVKLVAALCRTAGFVPYDAQLLKKLAGFARLSQTNSLIDKLFELSEFEVTTYKKVPEKFRALLGKNERFFDEDSQIIFHPVIFSLAAAEVEKHEHMALIGQLGKAASCGNLPDLEKEKKRSKRKEKEVIYNTAIGDLGLAIRNAGSRDSGLAIGDSGAGIGDSGAEIGKQQTKAVGELPATVEQSDTNVLTGNSRLSTERSESIGDSGAEIRDSGVRRAFDDEGRQMTLIDTPKEECFSARDFRDLWNRWAEHFQVAQFNKLTEARRKKLKNRIEAFKRQGAESRQFWINLLSAVAETGNGFYIGNNDGYHHCGTPWVITVDWLLKNDEHIERFLNAVRL